jgi:hypothetical protein
MNLHTTWQHLILQARLSSEENHQITSDLSTAANDTKCMDIAKVIRNGAFFVKAKDQLQPSLVHSFSQAEGNSTELGYGKKKSFILSGLDEKAFPLSFKTSAIFDKVEMHRFSYTEIFNTEDAAGIRAINPVTRTPGQNTSMISLRSCHYIPTGMADLIIRSKVSSWEDLIMVTKAFVYGSLPPLEVEVDDDDTVVEGQPLNEIPENQVAGNEAAQTTVVLPAEHSIETIEAQGGQILQWLMNFSKAIMKEVPLSPETVVNGIVQQASNDLHRSRLDVAAAVRPMEAAATLPLEAQASTFNAMEMMKAFGEKMSESLNNSGGTAPKATKMFQEQYKALGSIDGEHPLEQLSDEAMQILNARDQGERNLLMDSYLAMMNIEPNLSSAQARSICSGPLEWPSFNVPGGLSSFLMEIPGVDSVNSSIHTEYIIRLRSEYNVKTTKDEVDKILKQDIVPPRTIEELITILTQQCALIELFTHPEAIIVLNFKYVIAELGENMNLIRGKLSRDPEYLLKIQYRIDFKINALCKATKRYCRNVSKIKFSKMANFSPLVSEIENNNLYIDVMPPFVKRIAASRQDGEPLTKRQKVFKDNDEDKECVVAVKNKNPNHSWTLRDGESFSKVFKQHKNKPNNVCLSYWITNSCDNKCKWKHSHKSHLSKNQSQKMTEFVSSARDAAAKSDIKA